MQMQHNVYGHIVLFLKKKKKYIYIYKKKKMLRAALWKLHEKIVYHLSTAVAQHTDWEQLDVSASF